MARVLGKYADRNVGATFLLVPIFPFGDANMDKISRSLHSLEMTNGVSCPWVVIQGNTTEHTPACR